MILIISICFGKKQKCLYLPLRMMTNAAKHYILFNKPYGVLCQFTDKEGRTTLADFGPFPEDVYPAGRLDFESEGLVLLTDDGALKYLLLEPKFHHPRTYLVQVECIPSSESIDKLSNGVVIDAKRTIPAEVSLLDHEPELHPRAVPIRFRRNVPTAWLQMTLWEGRNRQVRRMTAAVGHPTLRLIRTGIGTLTLEGLQPGDHRNLLSKEISALRSLLTG